MRRLLSILNIGLLSENGHHYFPDLYVSLQKTNCSIKTESSQSKVALPEGEDLTNGGI